MDSKALLPFSKITKGFLFLKTSLIRRKQSCKLGTQQSNNLFKEKKHGGILLSMFSTVFVEKNRKCIQYDATAALDAENEK